MGLLLQRLQGPARAAVDVTGFGAAGTGGTRSNGLEVARAVPESVNSMQNNGGFDDGKEVRYPLSICFFQYAANESNEYEGRAFERFSSAKCRRSINATSPASVKSPAVLPGW